MIEIIFIVVLFVVAMVIVSVIRTNREAAIRSRQKAYRKLDTAYIRNVDAALNAKTSAGVRSRMESAEGYVDLMSDLRGTNMKELAYYQEDKKDMREYADDLEREEWERKAEKMLDEFQYNHDLIIAGDFNESDKMLYAKKRCLDILRKYNISWEGLHIYVSPKEYMKEFLGEDFRPYMTDATELGRVLDVKIAEMRPERARKQKLIKNIMDLVASQQSIMRSKLLNHPFPDCTADELKYTYKELLSKNRLAEIKIESRYFVTLSDKEAARRKAKEGK